MKYDWLGVTLIVFGTFALKALPEQPPQEPLAVLAHGRACVRVDRERVGHLHLAHQDFVQMDGPTCVEAPRLTGGPRLAERGDVDHYKDKKNRTFCVFTLVFHLKTW